MNSSVGHNMPISCTRPQRAGDVLAIEPLEEADLRLFARECADQPRAGVVLLRLRRDLGEARLDALEPVVDLASEILHQDAGQRHGRPAPPA